MHHWRRHAQRGAAARKGKWDEEEDAALLKASRVLLRQDVLLPGVGGGLIMKLPAFPAMHAD